MSFRARLAIAASAAVAVAIVLASVVIFVVVRTELRGQVDGALRELVGQAKLVPIAPGVVRVALPRQTYGGAPGYAQVVGPDGTLRFGGEHPIPVSREAQDVAAGRSGAFFQDVTVGEVHLRVLTTPLPQGLALQVARPLAETDQALRRLTVVLALVAAGGVGLATALGLVVTRAASRPIRSLMEATEHVSQTGDLTQRIDAPGTDEVSRLAASFNSMLGALESSIAAQRRLVADASHELRTPLTSLRTNIEVLSGTKELSPGDRERLLADVRTQIEELSTLVSDVVDAGRGDETPPPLEGVAFDRLVQAAVDRAAARWTRVRFTTELQPCAVLGAPDRLDRALRNLLDNAAKWSPDDGEVQVTLSGGELTVRDHGPGVAPEDLPRVFDRFYRAPSARGTPGSGLGLAIVKQVAESHGGAVTAESAVGGGGLFRLRLPVLPVEPELTPPDGPPEQTAGLRGPAARP